MTGPATFCLDEIEATPPAQADGALLSARRSLGSLLGPSGSRLIFVAALAALAMGPPGVLGWLGVDPIDGCPARIRDLANEWREWVERDRHHTRCEWRWATIAGAGVSEHSAVAPADRGIITVALRMLQEANGASVQSA